MVKVSVIVPIYGVEKYLKEAVDSILNQTLLDLEVILIDDGSKDRCPEIIDEYGKKDSRVIAIHKKNGGYGQSMNMGIDRASGEYIGIVEPDDYIDSKMYENLYKIAEEYGSDIVKSGFYVNYQTKKVTKIVKEIWPDDILEDRSFVVREYPCFFANHPSIWSAIYKRDFLNKNKIRFTEVKGAGWTDNLFQVQSMCLAKKINYTSEAYYYWRRLNIEHSDDLKDYTIPFDRSSEIHDWLDKYGINDQRMLVNLFRRELSYVRTVLGMKKIANKKDCYTRIYKLLCRCPRTFLKSQDVNESEVKDYLLFKKNPGLARRKILFKRFRRSLVSIRWNRREKSFTLFGHVLFYKLKGS